MIRPLSMTSYGCGDSASGPKSWTAEIRSVNHRFLDVKVKIPRKYSGLEERIKKEIATQFSRGHVDVTITPGSESVDSMRLVVNMPLARDYHQCLESISRELGLADRPSLAMIKDFREVITANEVEEDLDAIWPSIREALANALNNGLVMREQEGAALKKDLADRLQNFAATVAEIEKTVPDLVRMKEEKLKERLDKLLAGLDIDPMRLVQEVAILTDKSDITEELVRLKSHIDQFAHFLDSDEPIGRRLDFLLQEFLREINTFASKINNASMAHQSVDLKNEVEKLREQIQNLE
ncbi:MAG: YicC family protein [Desulfobulbaceae bacterium]|nr:YicC family protein [Desulfobulbaceae bacterium]HIJ78006.1 YicC family protein [Deltaproteobacteria bacterium]